MPGPQPADQDVGDEGLRRTSGEREVEAQYDEDVRAQGTDVAGLGAEGGQAEGVHPGAEHRAGVRLEGQHRPGNAGVPGDASRLADHRLVTQVDAVEVADRDRRPAGVGRQAVEMAKDPHGGK